MDASWCSGLYPLSTEFILCHGTSTIPTNMPWYAQAMEGLQQTRTLRTMFGYPLQHDTWLGARHHDYVNFAASRSCIMKEGMKTKYTCRLTHSQPLHLVTLAKNLWCSRGMAEKKPMTSISASRP